MSKLGILQRVVVARNFHSNIVVPLRNKQNIQRARVMSIGIEWYIGIRRVGIPPLIPHCHTHSIVSYRRTSDVDDITTIVVVC